MKDFNLSAWALRHQTLTLYFILVLMAAGVLAYFGLGQKEDPEFTFKVMVVRVLWPGAAAREVEQQVTDVIEKKLQETPGLDYVRSYSKPGEAVIFVTLKQAVRGRDVSDAWYQARKKVGDVRNTLPQEVIGPFFNDEFGDTFGSIYAFTADGFSYAEVKRYVDLARQELLRLPGVSKVDLVGVQDEKIYIEFSHRKMAAMGFDPQQIIAVLQAQNAMDPAGTVLTPGDTVYLRVSGDFKSVESIRDIGIRANGHSFRLGDVAKIYRGYVDPPTFRMRFMGKDAIGVAVSMTRDGDVIELGKALSSTIGRIKVHLPVGIEIHQVSDQPGVVGRSVSEFMRTLLEAVVIVLAVSFFSLGLRTGTVVALSIPLVLAVTFLFMRFFGIDLQRISLGALIIALGLLVDDAMISVEMMARKLEEGWDRVKAATFAYNSTAFPMLTGTLVTAAGFMPVGFARSNAGEYTFSIFAVVTTALLVSWVVAVVFTPYLGYKLLKEQPSHAVREDIFHRGFYARFRKWVEWCLEHRKTVIAATVAAFLLAGAGFRVVEQQFFPSSNRPELLVDLWLPEGSPFRATENEVKKFEKVLAGDSNIVNYVAYVGGGSPRFYLPLDQQLANLNYAQFVVMTKDIEAREAVLARLRKLFEEEFPMVRGRVTRLENGPPVGYPVQFRVVGPDSDVLRKITAQVVEAVRAHPNTKSVNVDWNEMIKVARLQVDQDKARALGISSQQLSRSLQSLLSGRAITQYREGDKLIDVVGRAQEDERFLLSALKDINVHTTGGKFVPLSQVAHIGYGFEEGIIWRRNRFPAMTVRADLTGHVQAPDVTRQIEPQLEAIRTTLPPDYRIETAGAREESAAAQASLAAVMPAVVVVIVTLLMLQLQSFSRTALVLATAPLGLIGVTLFLLLLQRPFGFVASLGFISLAGMIMRNSVILVDQIDQDIKQGLHPWNAIVESTVRRFRPIMLTAAAAILAMIPLARSTFWGPMAVAIMGGLFVATILTLLFLPALYAAWFRIVKPAASS
ncbi:MAG: efflux RND transporter permease subunit [Betaproteobacteria bacterium]|nr:efflux RND transporter permease subunit [Betaproteobacteria bacterium]